MELDAIRRIAEPIYVGGVSPYTLKVGNIYVRGLSPYTSEGKWSLTRGGAKIH